MRNKSTNIGGVGNKILQDFFACGKAQPGLWMRLDLQKMVAVIRGEKETFAVHTQRAGKYTASAAETASLLAKVEEGIRLLLRQRSEKGEPSAVEKLGMLSGRVYAHNRGEAHDPKLPDFMEAIEIRLAGQLAEPSDLYVGAATAFRGRETEIANINGYIDVVSGRFRGKDKLALASRMAYRIIDMGLFDASLLCGIVRHNHFDALQAAGLVDHVIEARAGVQRESYETIRRHITSFLDNAKYNVEQTADFLVTLAKKREYGLEQIADLVVDAARGKHLKSAEAKAHFYQCVIDGLGYARSRNKEFIAYLTRRGFF